MYLRNHMSVLKACTLLNVHTERALGMIAGPIRQAIACHPKSGIHLVPSTVCVYLCPGQTGRAFTGTKGLELRTLLMDSRPPAEHAVLRGHLFEFCLAKLGQGGRFPMRSLDEPGELCMPSNGAMLQL